MTKKEFETNFSKLEELSEQLKDNTLSIDELVPRMKEALASVRICKEVLKNTEAQLEEISMEFIEEQPKTR